MQQEAMQNQAREYIKTLQDNSSKTWVGLAKETGIPIDNINNFIYNRTQKTEFPVIALLVKALGGSLDELAGIPPRLPSVPEADVRGYEQEVTRLRQRIEDREQSHQSEMQRLVEAHKEASAHLKDNIKWQRILIVALLLFVLYLFIDASNASWGALKFRQLLSAVIGRVA